LSARCLVEGKIKCSAVQLLCILQTFDDAVSIN
jgi:hypothetical protein